MRTLHLVRNISNEQGTLGVIYEDDFSVLMLELPWRDNQRNISCIPAQDYECRYIESNHFGPCYWVQNVPGRSGILFHCGNVAGSKNSGYRTDSLGCLLWGSYSGRLWKQRAVLASRKARGKFLNHLQGDPFILSIKEAY